VAKPLWVLRDVLHEGGHQEEPCASAGAFSGAATQIKAQAELLDAQKMLHQWE